jgi:hypothetical protein
MGKRRAFLTLCLCVCVLFHPLLAHGQRRGQGPQGAARAVAPIDLTGYWVSIVTEDWQYRMVTPPKGEFSGLPLSVEGRRVAGTWDPAKDEASGVQCKAYAAPAIMRMPGHLHIVWEDDNTLRIDTDTGTQTRLFHFGSQGAGSEPTWQGRSAAQWQAQGNLKVVTTSMRPGYLRKNGIPYGENAILTEYYERISAPNNEGWLILTSVFEDPLYLTTPYVTSVQFRKLPDGSAWHPTPCSAR